MAFSGDIPCAATVNGRTVGPTACPFAKILGLLFVLGARQPKKVERQRVRLKLVLNPLRQLWCWFGVSKAVAISGRGDFQAELFGI